MHLSKLELQNFRGFGKVSIDFDDITVPDALFKADKETAEAIRGVLNSGAHHKGSFSRVVGTGTEMATKNFRTFCPKSIAGIGTLPDTVADRSLHIRLQRKLPDQKVERLLDLFALMLLRVHLSLTMSAGRLDY